VWYDEYHGRIMAGEGSNISFEEDAVDQIVLNRKRWSGLNGKEIKREKEFTTRGGGLMVI
jgi:hypothetical protein